VKSVKLSADRTKVFLEIEGLRPVDQMEIKMNVNCENGQPVPGRILNTIHTVPDGKTAQR
jgi:hypothetical protein